MITLVDVLNRHAAEQPEKIAVHFRDQSLTYAQLRRQAALLGGHLQSLGVTVGDRIMLTGASRPEYLIGLLAVHGRRHHGSGGPEPQALNPKLHPSAHRGQILP